MKRTSYDGWIEPINDFKVDIDTLIHEYQDNFTEDDFEDVYFDEVRVQRRYKLQNPEQTYFNVEKMPYTADVIKQVKSVFDFSHTHYRIKMPYTSYGWHTDDTEFCVHIPLITNSGCWFIYDDKQFRMPANGDVYLVHQGRFHTFVNSGDDPRLHLTFMNF